MKYHKNCNVHTVDTSTGFIMVTVSRSEQLLRTYSVDFVAVLNKKCFFVAGACKSDRKESQMTCRRSVSLRAHYCAVHCTLSLPFLHINRALRQALISWHPLLSSSYFGPFFLPCQIDLGTVPCSLCGSAAIIANLPSQRPQRRVRLRMKAVTSALSLYRGGLNDHIDLIQINKLKYHIHYLEYKDH